MLAAALLLGTLQSDVELTVGETASLGEWSIELVDLSGSDAAFAFYEGGELITGFEVVESGKTIRVSGLYLALEGVEAGKARVTLSDEAPEKRFEAAEASAFFEENYAGYGEPAVEETVFDNREAIVVYSHETIELPPVAAEINGGKTGLPATTIQRAAATYFDAETGEVLAEYTVN